MRLWNENLLPYLPKSQIVSQWRELNSIFKKQDNHILINYIYNYPKEFLYSYTLKVIDEFQNRNFKINKWDNFNTYFDESTREKYEYTKNKSELTYAEHNKTQILCNYYNLLEKYDRGQKDFSKAEYEKLYNFVKEHTGTNIEI